MKKYINQVDDIYSNEADITFLMKRTYTLKGNLISEELVGWYHGEPNKEISERYVGKLKAEYEED